MKFRRFDIVGYHYQVIQLEYVQVYIVQQNNTVNKA